MAKLSDLTDAQLETQLKKYISLFKTAQNADEKAKYKQLAMRLKEERQKRLDLQNELEPAAPPPPPKQPAAPKSAKPAKAAKPKAPPPPPAQKAKMKPGKAQTQQGKPRLWNPNAAANWAILFTPIFGAWLQKMNWEELNETERAEKSKKWAYVGGGFLIIALILPDALAMLLSVTFLLAWYFSSAKKQVKYVNDENINYEKREWKKPLTYAAGGLVGYLLLAVVLSVVFSILGSFSGFGNSDVSTVKNGTMNEYPNTTVGKAFEASFDDTKWEAFETDKGERVVEFTGTISDKLHDFVVDGLKEQMRGLQDYQKFQLQLNYLQEVVKNKGGSDSAFFKGLDNKYNCKLTYVNFAGGVLAWSPECKDEETTYKYMDEATASYVNGLWSPGVPVKVQWIITPDGERFNLTHMASSAWVETKYETILNVIYN